MGRQGNMLLQWHITDRCNCQCTHCYQDNTIPCSEPDWQQMIGVIEQFKELLAQGGPREGRGQITITGGEPFVHREFWRLLQLLASNKQYFDFAILTNGTLIQKEDAKRLKNLQPRFVQVSIEGVKSTHDQIRGVGNYRKTVEGIRYLVAARVPVFISFTAHRNNFREFVQVAELGARLKVRKVWADRHIPMGQGKALQEEMLTPHETQEFFAIMENAREQLSRRWFTTTKISLERGLQFLLGGGHPYCCTAGKNLITLMPSGEVYPCRRMPIHVGNISESSLLELYQQSPLLAKLRNPVVKSGCKACIYQQVCGGGLACLAYAVHGNPFVADPGCWYAK